MNPSRRIAVLGAAVASLFAGATLVHAAPSSRTTISFAKAETIALARVPGGSVEEIEREHRATRVVYEVEVRAPDGREHDLTIDAHDGTILAEAIDDD